MKNYYVYILTNEARTLYIGVTNDLERRLYEHKNKLIEGFTKKYNLTKLVYYETTTDIRDAIAREKQLKELVLSLPKEWLRIKKITLIEESNPGWDDLSLSWRI
jgi:putative endonuclease